MSYQGWASGTLTVHCEDSNQRECASECLEEESDHGCLHPFPPYRVAYVEKGFSLEVDFDCEIRYYFGDNLEELVEKLQEKIPGVKVTGAFWVSEDSNTSYRLDVDSNRHVGPIMESEPVDWLMNYSCRDIQKIQEYAEKNFKLDPIA